MLINLHVKNFAIIDETDVDFRDHLNILTGETGAGKSILIGSINAALGGKVSKEMIRSNAEYALVELLFETKDEQVMRLLTEQDIAAPDNQIIISRKIMSNGRNVNKINGENVTASLMKEIATYLLDLHGQHEHQSLLNTNRHLEFIDRYAKEDTEQLKSDIFENYHEYQKYKKELKASEIDNDKRLREISFLEYEINEIETASLVLGEDIELQSLYKKLSNANNIAEGISEIRRFISEDDLSAEDLISRSVRIMTKLSSYDDQISDFLSQIMRIESLLNDLNRDISEYISDMENTEEEFKAASIRLDIINHLKSKYGKTIEDIKKYLLQKKDRLAKLVDYDKYIEELNSKIKIKEKILEKLSDKLSGIRKSNAEILINKMTEALIELNFLDVRFDMLFKRLGDYSANGYDFAEFLISTNPGEPLQPLSKIASGGELSRIMLALKSVLADKDEIDTLIFDEIDVGVSGRTAQKVSEKLAVISKKHQVICITHLPQIAAMADAHYLIEKTTDGLTTQTSIIPLNAKDSVIELARMLGGAKITEHVIKNAEEMKELAKTAKISLYKK